MSSTAESTGLRSAVAGVARVNATRAKRAGASFVSAVVCSPDRSSMGCSAATVVKSSFEVSIRAVMAPSSSVAVVRRPVRRAGWPQSHGTVA